MKAIVKLAAIALLSLPALAGNAQPISLFAAGSDADHTLFVTADSNLWVMGNNEFGQVGTNLDNVLFPQRLGPGNVMAISAGAGHTLFLKSDGSLWALGDNSYGQLGDGSYIPSTNQPEQIIPNGVTAIAAGFRFSLFLTAGGGLWAMGDNSSGQLGIGTVGYQPDPVGVVIGGVTAISAGYDHSLFLKTDGSLWAMGNDAYGQLGDGGPMTNSLVPKQIVAGGVSAISAGYQFSLMLKTNGSLWAWGTNFWGQLGNGSTNTLLQPVMIVPSNVTAIAAGGYHSIFLKKDGTLWSMGLNGDGQLGDDTYPNRTSPLPVASNVVAIAAGYLYSLFMKSDGTLWGMGVRQDGNLGDGGVSRNVNFPEQILPLVIVWNSGFELGFLQGWTQTGNTNLTGVQTGPTLAHSGQFGLAAGPIGSLGFVSQFPRVRTSTYLLSFWLNNSDGLAPNQFLVQKFNYSSNHAYPLLNLTNVHAIGWTNIQLVTHWEAGEELQFGFRNDNSHFGLDDVSFTQPRPTLTGISIPGNFAVLSGHNAMLGATYLTLSSTNPALPLTQWNPIGTNVLSTNFLGGIFNVTNGVGDFSMLVPGGIKTNASGQFYILQLP